MTAWVVSIVSVCILTVLLDLIMSEGETKKYIKGIMNIIIVLVIISPVSTFFNKDISIDSYFDESSQEVSVDDSYLYRIYVAKYAEKELYLQKVYENQGIKGVAATISIGYGADMNVEILNVVLDISNAVIIGNEENININEMLVSTARALLNVNKERIIINGSIKNN